MPYMKDGKRDYKREYAEYHSSGKQKKNRASRNKLRRKGLREGQVHKGDNKDIDHTTPLSKGGSNSTGNTRIVSRSKNRSFARNRDSSIKSQTSKREKR